MGLSVCTFYRVPSYGWGFTNRITSWLPAKHTKNPEGQEEEVLRCSILSDSITL